MRPAATRPTSFGMRETLHVDGERAVRARSRRRDDSLGDLVLNEIHRAAATRRLERMKEDRGRDVVRHVPGEQKFLPGNLGEIHLEYIALDDLDIPRCAVAVAKIRRESAIKLDGDDPLRARGTSRSVRLPRPGRSPRLCRPR